MCGGCNGEKQPTEYQIKVDSLNIEYDVAYYTMLKYDSLFWEAKLDNDIGEMENCADSTKYYTRRMIKEYEELVKAMAN